MISGVCQWNIIWNYRHNHVFTEYWNVALMSHRILVIKCWIVIISSIHSLQTEEGYLWNLDDCIWSDWLWLVKTFLRFDMCWIMGGTTEILMLFHLKLAGRQLVFHYWFLSFFFFFHFHGKYKQDNDPM